MKHRVSRETCNRGRLRVGSYWTGQMEAAITQFQSLRKIKWLMTRQAAKSLG